MTYKSCTGFFSFNKKNPPTCDWSGLHATDKITEFPNMTDENLPAAFPDITPPVVSAYEQGATKIYARLRFDYQDIFGRQHFTESCFYNWSANDRPNVWTECGTNTEYGELKNRK
jgi:hypothetical protein